MPYKNLFEPVKIGPVVAPNRFYQVPHACGMGHLRPQAHAAMRETKAMGGWGVVCAEETEIHPSSDLSPYSEQRLWDERDIPALSLMVDRVKAQGSLAGIELVHNGHMAPNLYSRLPALSPTEIQLANGYPKMARSMDKQDIRDLRAWHRRAARNAKNAGFDIVYVYAGHEMTLPQHFLLSRYNQRSDEYGGSIENRTRLIRELLEETKEEIGDTCAVALRLAVEELKGPDGMQAHEEGRAVVELLADLPDLWDVNISDWTNDSVSARFEPDEGTQLEYISFVKELTGKPTVGVGRFTSPDLMSKLVRENVLDFIGAARPSIADPYLPNKIKNGQIESIRECIGCNICISSESLGVPIRCTQNPTMGEEWRRSWNPEIISPKVSEKQTLVVGAGPAGLECGLQLARRGYEVILAEAGDEFGGRALRESQLNGLGTWRRVTDNRVYELERMANVEMFKKSRLDADQINDFGADKVFIATGSNWRKDGTGRSHFTPLNIHPSIIVLTPDDIMNGVKTVGKIVIYDDDNGYMGGVVAEHLAQNGADVSFVTSGSVVSPFTTFTLEQHRIQASLIEKGVNLHLNMLVNDSNDHCLKMASTYGGIGSTIPCETLVLVTARSANRSIYDDFVRLAPLSEPVLLGDALSPGLIADATFGGHLAARSFEEDPKKIESDIFRREMPSLAGPN